MVVKKKRLWTEPETNKTLLGAAFERPHLYQAFRRCYQSLHSGRQSSGKVDFTTERKSIFGRKAQLVVSHETDGYIGYFAH